MNNQIKNFDLDEALEFLQKGKAVKRQTWKDKTHIKFMPNDLVKMLLPKVTNGKGPLLVKSENNEIKMYVMDMEDFKANDWQLVP